MSLSKLEIKIKELSPQLRKVYDATPIGEAWPAKAIALEILRLGAGSMDVRSTTGCLNSLLGRGLVEEVEIGHFKRTQIKNKVAPSVDSLLNPEVFNEEPKLQEKQPTQKNENKNEKINPIDRLSSLAARLRGLANDMESTALELAEQAEANEHKTAKMLQLQALLKSLD